MRAHAFDESDAVDELLQLRGRHRSDHVRAEHLTRQRDVQLQHIHTHGRARQSRVDGRRMIGEADPAPVSLAIKRHEVQADLLRRTRIRRRALEDTCLNATRFHAGNGRIDLRERAHAGRQQHGRACLENTIEQERVAGLS